MSANRHPGTHPASFVLQRANLPGTAGLRDVVVAGGVIRSLREASANDSSIDRFDLDGRTVLPGLWDAHVHAEQWAIARRRLDLRHTVSARDVADRVADAVRTADRSEVLVGYGYRDGLWPDEAHKDLLAAVAPGQVVVLQSNDLHTAWLSPAALERIGSPEHPTGVLHEIDCYRAMKALQEFDAPTVDRWVAEGLSDAASLGVTGLMDFEFGDSVVAWQRRASGHQLDVRVSCTVYPEHLESAIARGLPSGSTVPGTAGAVEVGPLKVFVDGSLNSRTALCHDPYPELADTERAHGLLETPPHELVALMRRAAAHGLDSAVHAIGDRATQMAIDAFEEVRCPGRIEHAQLVTARDVARLARLCLTVGIQPAHLLDDRDVADRHWKGRTGRAFAFADLLASGVRVEIGSDAPVAPLDPWAGIAAAVTRTREGREPWHPEQRIAVADALAAASRGRTHVREGDRADLVIVDHDPYRATDTRLADPGIAGTVCGGRWTFRAF